MEQTYFAQREHYLRLVPWLVQVEAHVLVLPAHQHHLRPVPHGLGARGQRVVCAGRRLLHEIHD